MRLLYLILSNKDIWWIIKVYLGINSREQVCMGLNIMNRVEVDINNSEYSI